MFVTSFCKYDCIFRSFYLGQQNCLSIYRKKRTPAAIKFLKDNSSSGTPKFHGQCRTRQEYLSHLRQLWRARVVQVAIFPDNVQLF